MNRRALFSFFAVAPIVAVGEVAKAMQPKPTKLEIGDCVIDGTERDKLKFTNKTGSSSFNIVMNLPGNFNGR